MNYMKYICYAANKLLNAQAAKYLQNAPSANAFSGQSASSWELLLPAVTGFGGLFCCLEVLKGADDNGSKRKCIPRI